MGPQRFVRVIGGAAAVLALGLLGATPALAQVQPTAPTTAPAPTAEASGLGDVLAGTVPQITGSAKGGFGDDDTLDVTLTFTNATAKPAAVTVPRGALFKSEDPSEQTAVAAGPRGEDPTAVRVGVDPTITIAPGRSTVTIRAYCGQHHDSGPMEIVPLTYVGVAQEPLPRVMTNLARLHPDLDVAAKAVWWVTDDPEFPVPAQLRPFLEGVDTRAFASEPRQVVPDPMYTPGWQLEEFGPSPVPDTGGGGGPSVLMPLLIVTALALGGVAVAVAATRSSRRTPVVAASSWQPHATGPPAGWLPDPSDPRWLRYWDGTNWTSHTRQR